MAGHQYRDITADGIGPVQAGDVHGNVTNNALSGSQREKDEISSG